MDPALKEYLDAMRKDTAALKESIDSNSDARMEKQEAMARQITAQSSQLADLCGWKPDLEARFAKLQASVADLQRAQPSAAAWSGSAAAHQPATSFPQHDGTIHGPDGHGVDIFPGGSPAGTSASPPAPPVTVMISLQHPMNQSVDPHAMSSQIIASLGPQAPNFPFPPFTGDNPNLWITLAEQYFLTFAIHESFWVSMGILHFSGVAGIWL